MKSDSYKAAGVDIDLAQKLLSGMKSKIAAAKRPEMLAPVGGFGGLFELDLTKYKKPVIVSSVDGVGTKLMIAMMMNKFDSIGYDIVNHCINDIAVCGAEPLYFMDYIGIGKLRSPLYEEVLSGIADACKLANCALLGGETAEMPGMYGEDFDLVGSITGVVEKENLITGENIKPGHIAVGMASNGLHTNGYSLARHIIFEKCRYDVHTELKELDTTVGEALLKPHTCYWSAIEKIMQTQIALDGMAHITGGGLYDNVPRILPKTVNVEFNSSALPVPPIMTLINEAGNIAKSEAYRVFNMGIGMVLFVPESDADKTVELCRNAGYTTEICGKVTKGDGTVIVN